MLVLLPLCVSLQIERQAEPEQPAGLRSALAAGWGIGVPFVVTINVILNNNHLQANHCLLEISFLHTIFQTQPLSVCHDKMANLCHTLFPSMSNMLHFFCDIRLLLHDILYKEYKRRQISHCINIRSYYGEHLVVFFRSNLHTYILPIVLQILLYFSIPQNGDIVCNQLVCFWDRGMDFLLTTLLYLHFFLMNRLFLQETIVVVSYDFQPQRHDQPRV